MTFPPVFSHSHPADRPQCRCRGLRLDLQQHRCLSAAVAFGAAELRLHRPPGSGHGGLEKRRWKWWLTRPGKHTKSIKKLWKIVIYGGFIHLKWWFSSWIYPWIAWWIFPIAMSTFTRGYLRYQKHQQINHRTIVIWPILGWFLDAERLVVCFGVDKFNGLV